MNTMNTDTNITNTTTNLVNSYTKNSISLMVVNCIENVYDVILSYDDKKYILSRLTNMLPDKLYSISIVDKLAKVIIPEIIKRRDIQQSIKDMQLSDLTLSLVVNQNDNTNQDHRDITQLILQSYTPVDISRSLSLNYTKKTIHLFLDRRYRSNYQDTIGSSTTLIWDLMEQSVYNPIGLGAVISEPLRNIISIKIFPFNIPIFTNYDPNTVETDNASNIDDFHIELKEISGNVRYDSGRRKYISTMRQTALLTSPQIVLADGDVYARRKLTMGDQLFTPHILNKTIPELTQLSFRFYNGYNLISFNRDHGFVKLIKGNPTVVEILNDNPAYPIRFPNYVGIVHTIVYFNDVNTTSPISDRSIINQFNASTGVYIDGLNTSGTIDIDTTGLVGLFTSDTFAIYSDVERFSIQVDIDMIK